MKICLFCKFFNDKINLERMLSKTASFVDYIVLCDDSSTDGSRQIAENYTKDILTLPDIFEEELSQKQQLLEFALEKYPDIEWFLQLDSDEILEQPEKITDLCRMMSYEGFEGIYCHLKNLWLSEDSYRVDNAFNSLWKVVFFKNNGKLKFNTNRGLHQFQHPATLEKFYYSDLEVIHYGFVSRELIQQKYDKYKSFGQKGWSLERLNPDSKVVLRGIYSSYLGNNISVIVPVFNQNLEFFKQCLDSIRGQTYQNFEIIVIDDGSYKEFVEQNKNIAEVYNARYIWQENGGIGKARNRGILEAKGNFLYFLSSDDWFMPDALETMINSYKDEGFYWSDNNILTNGRLITNSPRFNSYEDFVIACVESAKISRMFLCYNIFGSKKLWEENLFDEVLTKNEDLEHMLRCMLVKKITFHQIPKVLFTYRIHQDMWSNKLGMAVIAERNKYTFDKINKMLGDKIL